MKIDFMNNTYIVYLNKYNIINFDFNNTMILEDNIRNLLIRLKKYYKLDIKGCYNIVIYIFLIFFLPKIWKDFNLK